MSNKKYRRPPETSTKPPGADRQGREKAHDGNGGHGGNGAHGADRDKADECAPKTSAERRRKHLDECTPEQLRRHVEEGWRLFRIMGARCVGMPEQAEPLSDFEAAGALADGVRFLHQVVYLTGCVLETVDTKELRRVVGPELKMPDSMKVAFEAAGIRLEEAFENADDVNVESEPQAEDHRKRPRGRKHPLLVLFTLAVQATRLIDKITAKTNPHVHNKPTREEAKQEDEQKEMNRLWRAT